jgi:hypothetical protein
MRSPRGVAAAIFFLSALPLAAVFQAAAGRGGETVIHFTLALGSGLLCSAVPDFRASRWATWLGFGSTGALAGIFALQGISEPVRSATITRIAFQMLGQHLEGWLLNGLIVWCIAVLLAESRGKTRIVGLVALSLTAAARAYATVLDFRGTSLDSTVPGLKLLYLLPFVWLLLEGSHRATRRPHSIVPSSSTYHMENED